ncbi:hypothetical protein TTHERM_00954370 (macronuclear) [Tetrahymena thermophila SB210]|uniref:Uncharacterized protein n=1 Tax=Tetrahymena thermophila (strain SB210) TaxID=312017 RepID=Q23MM7_TETTS|nr:hypothetical protein TTHERM_00954370 [Tetrahymena thermophila SB210]EAR97815.2 hypothetical protein TTHERM_00954370 [Tetrahymena thermophila SB210]|eukprot:XP_001018060.2 hypothetical protein TTHERM_00954370 [Tetrahymena thermophila SB210]
MNEDFFKQLSINELKAYKQRLQIRNNDMNNMVEYMKKENENLEEMKSFLSNHQQHITLLLKRQETREFEKKARNKIFTTIIQNGVNMLPTNLNPKNLINYFSNLQNNDVPDQQISNDEDYQKKISNQPSKYLLNTNQIKNNILNILTNFKKMLMRLYTIPNKIYHKYQHQIITFLNRTKQDKDKEKKSLRSKNLCIIRQHQYHHLFSRINKYNSSKRSNSQYSNPIKLNKINKMKKKMKLMKKKNNSNNKNSNSNHKSNKNTLKKMSAIILNKIQYENIYASLKYIFTFYQLNKYYKNWLKFI